MINIVLKNFFFKLNAEDERFLLIALETSEGIFEVDNCVIRELNMLPNGYHVYDRNYYNHNSLITVKIIKILYTPEMDFIIILDNNKVIIVSGDDNFDNLSYSQILQVYDYEGLSKQYLDDAEYCYLR